MSKRVVVAMVAVITSIILALAVNAAAPIMPEASTSKPQPPTVDEISVTKNLGMRTAVIETSKGVIEVQLRGDAAPLTVANFVKLVGSGFYNNLKFHRVEDWVLQGGDPSGTGAGGPGYAIKLEIAKGLSHTKGAIGMARTMDPNSAGSQFYIVKTDAKFLDGKYAVFGHVTKGMEVVESMKLGDVIKSITIK